MAEDRNYIITLKIEGSSNAGASSAVAGSSTQSQKQAVASSENKTPGLLQSAESRAAFTSSLVAWHTIKPFATQQINYRVSLVELTSGSREMQEKANFINQLTQKGVGLAESVAAGALLGGGPGALVGALVGVTSSVIGVSQKVSTYMIKDSLENYSIEMSRVRASSLGSRSNNQ